LLQEAYHEAAVNNTALEKANTELAEVNARLEALATTDGMTRLPNHRHFQERFREELAQGQRNHSPVSLFLLDVDKFKQYNDSFGHPAGDEALRILARVLQENLRVSDLPARYGGEEFAVILPGTDSREAMEIAERVRAAIEREAFPHRLVTVSIGVVVAQTFWEAEPLIAQADSALYAAKVAGRNRVQFHTEALEKAA
jgi:diguanylate cyclase (GGDEF)-like protein